MSDICIFRRIEKKYLLTPTQYNALRRRINGKLEPDESDPLAAAKRELFVTGEGLEIFSAMDDVYREDADFELTDLKDRLSESALNYLQQILDEIRIGEDDKKAFDDCMERLEQAKRARRITEIGDILSMADPDTDPVYIKQLTEELVTLNQMNKR